MITRLQRLDGTTNGRVVLSAIVARFVPVPGIQGNPGLQGIPGQPGLNGDGNLDGFVLELVSPAPGETLIYDGTKFINAPLEIINGGAF